MGSNPSGKFTTKSIYRLIKNSGEVDTKMTELWQTKIPLKVKIFLCFGTTGSSLGISLKLGKAKALRNANTVANLKLEIISFLTAILLK